MRFHLEAEPDELEAKSDELVKALGDLLLPVAPELASRLEKALPRKEQALKYPVLRSLQNQTQDIYDKHLKRMIQRIGKVFDTTVSKSEADEINDFEMAIPEGLEDDLWKALGHKYIRRVPYTDGKGHKRYRYYYRQSAAAREARAGEDVSVAGKLVKVLDVGSDSITIQDGDKVKKSVEAATRKEEEADKIKAAKDEAKAARAASKDMFAPKPKKRKLKKSEDHYDHTQVPATKDDIAYRRVKQVLINLGFMEFDFEEGGALWGYSTNQLIDLARSKRD